MPSKANAKGSGAKNETNPVFKDATRARTSHDLNTSDQAPSQPRKLPTAAGLNQSAIPGQSQAFRQQAGNIMTSSGVDELNREGGVNKKKQKRRMKEAAKKAADADPLPQSDELGNNSYQEVAKQMDTQNGEGGANGYDYEASDYDDQDPYEPDEGEDMYYTDEATQQGYPADYRSIGQRQNGHANHDRFPEEAPGSKTKKKRKSKSASNDAPASNIAPLHNHNSLQRPPPPPPPAHGSSLLPAASQHTPHAQRDSSKIWNTSTAEERERIKEFWLSLGEDERKSLVKIEKEAVLKKMKEQQKHSCSCTVCGRKRIAIEEELEVLYDAYYEELEQYANNQQISLEDGAPMIPQRRLYHPMSPNRAPQSYNQHNSRGRIQELVDDDDDLGEEDEDSEAGEEDEMSDDYDNPEAPPQNQSATDVFNFGNSLMVRGGILTVADDLLKNDGKKFIEMMEQLAERRMQREEDAQHAAQGLPMQHSHSSNLDQDPYGEDDEEEDDYDSAEDDEYEEDDAEAMTEEQRMEEGRRMFQIFAARMFEQRVLTAYREKVALERQQKLIEELDDESKLGAQREAKKLKEAQKKKDKKRQQKQAKDEEKAKREAELAAQEAAARALEDKKAEEIRQKKEEQRRKRDAEKKAQEEEKLRKEAEKQRRLQEARDLQQEQERKQREQKEREKKKKDEAKKKEREAREKEAKERKDREIKERRDREATTKSESKKEEPVKPAGAATQSVHARPSPANTNSSTNTTGAPPSFLPPHTSSIPNSPHLPIAIPVVPKAPTPIRARQSSFQDIRTSSPRTSIPPPLSSTTSPSVTAPLHSSTMKSPPVPLKQPTPPQPGHTQNLSSPRQISPGSTTRPPGFPSMPAPSGLGFSPAISDITQSAQHLAHIGQYPMSLNLNNKPFAGGTNGARANAQGIMQPPPLNSIPGSHFGAHGQQATHRASVASHTHSRNTSSSSNVGGALPTPISRPTPKQRPPSAGPDEQGRNGTPSIQDLENGTHLGSSALLGDAEDILIDEPRRGSMALLGGNQNTRSTFGAPQVLPSPIGTSIPRGMQGGNGTWSNQQSPFGNPPSNHWPSTPGFGRQNAGNGFGSIGSSGAKNSSTQRAITVRTLIANSCQKLTARSPMGPMNGWHPVESVLRDVNISKPQQVGHVDQFELLTLCETVGNTQNGGGNFEVLSDPTMGVLIHFTLGRSTSTGMGGEIGSPIGGPPGRIFSSSRPFP